MTDTMGRIQQIQSTLTQLTQPAVAADAASGTSGSGSTGGSTASTFADALTAATRSSTVGGASGMAATGTAATGSAAELIAATEKYVGLPYVWGGNDASVGLDCSSFVQHAFRDIGIDLPRVTWDQMKEGTPVASMADAKPGDLLFSFDGGHVSIYLGNGKAIDAPQPGDTIQVRDAWENDSNITAIRRILPDESTVQAAGGVGGAATGAAAGSSALTADQQSALTELIGAAQLSTSTGLGSMLSGQIGTAGAISAMLSGQTGNGGLASMLSGQGSAGSGQLTDLLATAQAAMATGQRA
ncbi:C40 family peptidase [Arthrobacter sulfonylureivorans]|uniref:C40 family peptidase n=1 Tax=Arthrobacter sulfonylureivorans TaxID=2486855 RepID=A0ABY3WC64_9MICC|nr:C40 family peptidase [Arthrobacter sulfonylureivorans]UNK46805.1 C40 family peptidase [Arthrobacter sulfonylureivorans]